MALVDILHKVKFIRRKSVLKKIIFNRHKYLLKTKKKGFGPTSGRSPSERIKDAYNHGYPTGLDSQQPGAFGNNGFPSPTGTDQTGIHGHNGKTPSNLGSSSFLNRPIANGKPAWQIDTTGVNL